jgi:RNA polymerase sigma-70 factor (ECF subfamily)
VADEPGRSGASDEQALRRFLAGDAAAFDELVRRHQDRVFRLALAHLGDREEARDASQEVFLRAFRGLRTWRFEARVGTWLFRLTLNVCRELRRRRLSERLKQSRFLRLVWPNRRSEAEHAARADSTGVGRLVDGLPPRQKETVLLRVYQELSVAETAAVLGVPEGTVKSNFFKAMRTLRARLAAPDGAQTQKGSVVREA